MRYRIKIERQAEKRLARLPEVDRLKIIASLPIVAQDPFAGKKLQGKLKGVFSYRVWPYRILYKIYKDYLVIVVVGIGHRKDIYK